MFGSAGIEASLQVRAAQTVAFGSSAQCEHKTFLQPAQRIADQHQSGASASSLSAHQLWLPEPGSDDAPGPEPGSGSARGFGAGLGLGDALGGPTSGDGGGEATGSGKEGEVYKDGEASGDEGAGVCPLIAFWASGGPR